jgi:hypothetical protein
VDGLTTLNRVEKDIAVAMQGVQIKFLSEKDFGSAINILIANTHLNCGIKQDEMAVDKTIDELIRDLRKCFSTITMEEIQLAFSKGWKKEYGDFFGLNNKTYFEWVSAHMYEVNRANVRKAMQDAKEKEVNKPELTEKEKEAIIHEGALKCFRAFFETKIITDYGNITYDYLSKIGIIPFTAEVKKKIMAECKARMIEEEKMKKTQQAYIGKHQGINDEIKKLEEGKSTRLISESKREALKQYFIQLIEMDEQLENLI